MQINKDIITSPNGFSPSQNYELSKSKDDNDEKTSTNFECNSGTRGVATNKGLTGGPGSNWDLFCIVSTNVV